MNYLFFFPDLAFVMKGRLIVKARNENKPASLNRIYPVNVVCKIFKKYVFALFFNEIYFECN